MVMAGNRIWKETVKHKPRLRPGRFTMMVRIMFEFDAFHLARLQFAFTGPDETRQIQT
jgi:hypothetical protein